MGEVRKKMKKKIIGILVCMLLIGTVLPVSGTVIVERTPISTSLGDTLYVGGSGPGNYSSIQIAIDSADDGDSIFVYDDSSPYYENVVIDKSVNLIGENKQTTIIDGRKIGDVVKIIANQVNIKGFTIKNSSYYHPYRGAGINIESDDNIISDNIILNNGEYGLYIHNSNNCWILGNTITFNNHGVSIPDSSQILVEDNFIQGNRYTGIGVYRDILGTKIMNNIIMDSKKGVYIFNCRFGVKIKGNIISENDKGITIQASSKVCTISENTINSNSKYGIEVFLSEGNLIYKNNFEDNGENAYIEFYRTFGINKWNLLLKGNYWDDWDGSGPKIIHGIMYLTLGREKDISISWINIDWFPAREPYDIP